MTNLQLDPIQKKKKKSAVRKHLAKELKLNLQSTKIQPKKKML